MGAILVLNWRIDQDAQNREADDAPYHQQDKEHPTIMGRSGRLLKWSKVLRRLIGVLFHARILAGASIDGEGIHGPGEDVCE